MKVSGIRRATPGDAAALAACIDAAYAIYASRISDLPKVSEGIEYDIKDNIVWVAERDDAIVGGLILKPQTDFMLLANIAVHPDHGGQGVGRALMDRAESDASALGMTEMRLSTHVDMPENVALYEYLGWKETERTGNKVKMRKQLV